MTSSEGERIAVLEIEVKHLNDEISKMSLKQDEMYNLMMQGKGGWKTLALVGGICMTFGGIIVAIAQFFQAK